MRFSVIIPCYNAGPWVAQCLRSVAEQTHPAHETIVIDDGSSDDSVEQIRNSGVPVRLVQTTRANGAGARNAGIEIATGDWAAFLDADDYWYPEHLARVVSLVSGRDAAYMGIQDFLYADGTEHPVANPWPVAEPTSGLPDDELPRLWRHALKFAMSTVCVDMARLRDVGAFDATQVKRHDFDMFFRVIKDRTWAYDPVSSAMHRVDNPGSISRENWARSEYFQFRGLSKNLPAYPGLEPIVKDCARRVMASAITDGDADDRARAKQLVWGTLSPRQRLVFTAALAAPALFRALNRAKRRVQRKRQAERGVIGKPSLGWIDRREAP